MIGIGWTEMLVIGVVALIFIRPSELPALMQRIGKALGSIRRMGQEFQREINRSTGLDAVTDLRKSITEPFKKTTAEIAREFNVKTPTGQTKPSGVLKPADPKAESVVKEIHDAAGMTTEAPGASPVMTPLSPPPVPVVKPVGPPPASPEAWSARMAAGTTPPVSSVATLPPVEPVKKTPRRRAAKKAVESPGPIEALAPATASPPKPRRKAAPRVKAIAPTAPQVDAPRDEDPASHD